MSSTGLNLEVHAYGRAFSAVETPLPLYIEAIKHTFAYRERMEREGIISIQTNCATVAISYTVTHRDGREEVRSMQPISKFSQGDVSPENHAEHLAWEKAKADLTLIRKQFFPSTVAIQEIVVHSERPPCSHYYESDERACENFFIRELSSYGDRAKVVSNFSREQIHSFINQKKYEFVLMSELPDHNPEKAEVGKFYLSPEGHYVVRDSRGKVHKSRLPRKAGINLDDLENKLNDRAFKESILNVVLKNRQIIQEKHTIEEIKSAQITLLRDDIKEATAVIKLKEKMDEAIAQSFEETQSASQGVSVGSNMVSGESSSVAPQSAVPKVREEQPPEDVKFQKIQQQYEEWLCKQQQYIDWKALESSKTTKGSNKKFEQQTRAKQAAKESYEIWLNQQPEHQQWLKEQENRASATRIEMSHMEGIKAAEAGLTLTFRAPQEQANATPPPEDIEFQTIQQQYEEWLCKQQQYIDWKALESSKTTKGSNKKFEQQARAKQAAKESYEIWLNQQPEHQQWLKAQPQGSSSRLAF